jgi:serine/threonine protein kinase
VRLLGRGATAEVVLARDLELDRDVAVKVLTARLSDDPTVPERFARETVIAARLGRHPHVVTVHDAGRWRGRPFMVMELQQGGSVADVLANGSVPQGRALRWLRETADAVDTAHEVGVVHRDLKPANLLLDDRDRVQVADFGIASAAGAERLTLTGTILGTAGYLAPEQARGETATPASDVYALGVIACELLTGARPPSSRPEPALARVLARALAERPEERHATAADLVADVEQALAPTDLPATLVRHPTVPAGPTVTVRRRRSTSRALRVARTIGATIAAGLVAAIAIVAFGYVRADTPAATTCTVSPRGHDANIVATGVDAKAYCAERAETLKWTMRYGRKLRSPDLSQPLTVVCRSEDPDLRVTVYDNGKRELGTRVCGQVTSNGLALG